MKQGYTCQGRQEGQCSLRLDDRAGITYMHFPYSRYISESRSASDKGGNILYTCSRRCGSSLASRSGNGDSENERRGGSCEDWEIVASNSCFIGALKTKREIQASASWDCNLEKGLDALESRTERGCERRYV